MGYCRKKILLRAAYDYHMKEAQRLITYYTYWGSNNLSGWQDKAQYEARLASKILFLMKRKQKIRKRSSFNSFYRKVMSIVLLILIIISSFLYYFDPCSQQLLSSR